MPHDVRCGCHECVTSRQEDSLRHSRSRVNAYRALASPSLIALSSKDPILTAFELSWELRRLSMLEHEFKSEYQELRKQCMTFATALLDHTRTSYELEVMLNHDPTGPAFEHGERMHLNRLKLAIKYKQKKFVAHSNVQQLLASLWYEGLPGFRRKNIVLQTLQIVWIGFLFPVYSIVYIFFPHTTLGQTMRKPFIKFICHSASYVTFLCLLILASQRIETVITGWLGTAENEKTSEQVTTKRGSPPTLIECMILAWVFGLIWAEIKQLWEDGLIEYIGDMWNIIDFVTNSLYVATIALRAVAYYQVQKEIALNTGTANLDREHWDDWDPMLISEGLFAAANIFSSLKLVYIFSVNPHLGPLQISLGRMVIDIMKFFFVLSLVLFAFACGMNQLLWYYADTERQHCLRQSAGVIGGNGSEHGGLYNATTDDDIPKTGTDACYKWRRFANLFESTQTLFWAVFGLIDLNNFELAGIKSYTRFLGMLMFGTYSVINVVVLLNLLIAMMNHSYQLIFDKADVEWKFARGKLWISYFEEGATVPPPFNVIPTPKSIYYLFRWFYRRIYGRSRAAKKEHLKTIRKARQASERDYRYQSIMRNLVRRYVTVEQRKADNQGVTEDDVNEIKQDISSFRYELIEILKKSGMNTSSAQEQPQGPGGKKCRLKERRLMKGFNIGRAESFPLTESRAELYECMAPSSAPPISSGTPIKSPLGGKAKRMARLSSNKQQHSHQSRRRWGTLMEAAKTVKHTLGRSLSEDSFGSGSSLEQPGASSNGEAAASPSSDIGSGLHHVMDSWTNTPPMSKIKSPSSTTVGGPTASRMSNLKSRFRMFAHLPSRFKVPSFDDSKYNAKARRHIYGGKIHTGSLKAFPIRVSGPLFASQRALTKSPAVQSSGDVSDAGTTPPDLTVSIISEQPEAIYHNQQVKSSAITSPFLHQFNYPSTTLTPIPSQPGSTSSTRMSINDTTDAKSPSSPPQSGSAMASGIVLSVNSSTIAGGGCASIDFIRTPPSPLASSSTNVLMVSSPDSSCSMSESTSQEPLVGRRDSSAKPSNGLGMGMASKLPPGVQPLGKQNPGGWL
ncbi:hypothetical protein CHUAL_003162 [Chamberlinius hualienensis]